MGKFVASWGILGTGSISTKFVRDIQFPAQERGVTDVSHAIAAVSSRSREKAVEFINTNCPTGGQAVKEGLTQFKTVAACQGRDELLADKNASIIYVGTPNTAHFDDAKASIEAGKHVLLEKPATLNAAEFKILSDLAKEKKVFFMEAMWIRFNPTMYKLQDLIFKENAIGDIRAVFADLSENFIESGYSDDHRVINPQLAGGPILDLGPYPLSYAMMLLYHHPKNELTPPEQVTGSMVLAHTSVDLTTSFSMTFPKLKAQANLSCSIAYITPSDSAVRIIGSLGEIIIPHPSSRPTKITLRKRPSADRNDKREMEESTFEHPMSGWGLQYEADETARCIATNKLESDRMPHKETLMTMGIFDKIRELGGYKYAPGLERA